MSLFETADASGTPLLFSSAGNVFCMTNECFIGWICTDGWWRPTKNAHQVISEMEAWEKGVLITTSWQHFEVRTWRGDSSLWNLRTIIGKRVPVISAAKWKFTKDCCLIQKATFVAGLQIWTSLDVVTQSLGCGWEGKVKTTKANVGPWAKMFWHSK